MVDQTWTWAPLDDRGLELVQEAERTLGAEVVLVYAEGAPHAAAGARMGLTPAPLDDSQLDCIQGLERMLGGVAIAYQRA